MRSMVRAAQHGVAVEPQQLGPIDLRCHLAAYFGGRIESDQRWRWRLNADPLCGRSRLLLNSRTYVATTLVAALAWQVYVVLALFRHVPSLSRLWSNFGGEPPFLWRLLADNYHFSPLLPLLSAALIFDALRRTPTSYSHAASILGLVLVSTLCLDFFASEALLAPILEFAASIE
jgi:hypothetical protein